MKRLLTSLLAALPLAAFAHGGHGHVDAHNFFHYLTEPTHTVPILALIAVGALVLFRRFGSRKPRTSTGRTWSR